MRSLVPGVRHGLPSYPGSAPPKDGAAGGGIVSCSLHGGQTLCISANPADAAKADPHLVLGDRSDSLHAGDVGSGEQQVQGFGLQAMSKIPVA